MKQSQSNSRKPSGYNIFMREEIKRVRDENPEYNQKLVFSLASGNWKKLSPEDTQVYLDSANSEKVEKIAEKETSDEIIVSKSKRKRKPTAYNIYMGQEICRLKAESPCIDHKEAFKLSAQNWGSFKNKVRNLTG